MSPDLYLPSDECITECLRQRGRNGLVCVDRAPMHDAVRVTYQVSSDRVYMDMLSTDDALDAGFPVLIDTIVDWCCQFPERPPWGWARYSAHLALTLLNGNIRIASGVTA